MMASWKLGPGPGDRQQRRQLAEQSPLTAPGSPSWPRRRGSPRGCPVSCPASRDRRPGARPPPRRRHDRVHRLDGGRQVLPALLGRVEHERLALECGGQVPAHRDAGVRRPRRGRDVRRLGCLPQPGRGVQRGLEAARARSGEGRATREGRRRRRADPPRRPARPEDADGGDRRRDRLLGRVLGYIETGKDEGAGPTGGARVREETGATTSSRRSSTPPPCRTR